MCIGWLRPVSGQLSRSHFLAHVNPSLDPLRSVQFIEECWFNVGEIERACFSYDDWMADPPLFRQSLIEEFWF